MIKTRVGEVTIAERNEIQKLYERRNGLTELAKIVDINNVNLYDKFVKDLGTTSTRYQTWWNQMSKKYNWPSVKDGNWEINFDTREIFLVTNV